MAEDGTHMCAITGDIDNHPSCPHGPTLLFQRNTKTGHRQYYACAACRDRKLCRFFHWADESYSKERRKMWELERQKYIGEQTPDEIYSTVHSLIPQILKKQVDYCHTCNCFVVHKNMKEHCKHDTVLGVTLNQIKHPTELLKPLECNKKEAQYLFSDDSIKTIISIAERNNIQSVLCIGTPRIHEYIKTTSVVMDSMLLDFDRRYHMFYRPEEFCWYNSFNNHFFFGNNAKKQFIKFLLRDKGEGFMIILDPPFGGRLEPLANTLQSIQKLHKELNPDVQNDIQVILIYPYYMEKHVRICLPKFSMVDYKILYENHSTFSEGLKARKLGSPVRIFTNMSLENVVLPREEGYKFCELCMQWVSAENTHCKYCQKCTSKNGSTYVHCFKCKQCVKPTWQHCSKCHRCCLPSHECTSVALSIKCYCCGREGHKRQDCLNVNNDGGVPVVIIGKGRHKRKREATDSKQNKAKCRR